MNESFWKELRGRFFKECTDDVPIGPGVDATRKKVNLTPHHVFEWFKEAIEASLRENGGDNNIIKQSM